MITQSIPSATIPPVTLVQSSGSTVGFSEMLSKTLNQDASNIDQQDEDEALRELFHLVSRLSVGVVDTDLLSEKTSSNKAMGHYRREVETLKETIRLILRDGQDDEDLSIDPATGKPKPGKSGHGHSKLRALFHSLPDEIKNLLRRAFPKLDELLTDQDRNPNGPNDPNHKTEKREANSLENLAIANLIAGR